LASVAVLSTYLKTSYILAIQNESGAHTQKSLSFRDGGVAQVVEHLPSEALRPNPSTIKKKKKKTFKVNQVISTRKCKWLPGLRWQTRSFCVTL
jgi:hypothetical protein